MSVPQASNMLAVGISKHGDFDVIEQFDNWPVPTLQPTQVLIKVEWAGANFSDNLQRRGGFPFPTTLPKPLGVECTGTIVALPTDESVLANEEFKNRGLTLGGRVAAFNMGPDTGTFAEYTSPVWSSVYALPEGISTRTGAATFTSGGTALSMITEAYDVKPRDTILVHSVAGSLGLSFTQLIKARGATVIGTTSSREKAEQARAYGADHVIVYKEEDFATRVLEITGGLGVNAIFDGVGKDTFEGNMKVIGAKGTIVWVGLASGPVPLFPIHTLVMKSIKYIFASAATYTMDPKAGREYVEEVFRLVKAGTLKEIVYGEYPLSADGVRQTQMDIMAGKTVGKLLVKVA